MKKENSQSKWQMFFMLIFIPGVFAIILAIVVLSFMNINVFDSAKQAVTMLPFVDSKEEVEAYAEQEKLEELLVQLEHENNNYVTAIENLEYQLNEKDNEIIDLQEQLRELSETPIEGNESFDEQVSHQDVVKTLEGMTASNAAKIVSEMAEEEVVIYLKLMKTDARSQILSRMDPEKAAEIISKLAD